MKITKVNASFSMKKSLGNYEMADIFFAAEAEIVGEEEPEKVAQEVHDFCKRLAVEKYNSFSKVNPPATHTGPEAEYFESDPVSDKPLKVWKPKPGEIEELKNRKWPQKEMVMAIDQEGTKKKINKEANTLKPL